MKLILIFLPSKKLNHLTNDFHVMNVHTKPTDKAMAIHMASSLPAIAVAHLVDGAMILF